MSAFKDLTGKTFNRLTVLSKSNRRASGGSVIWNCECVCGNKSEVSGNALRSGATKSCGCFMRERVRESNGKNVKHGFARRGKTEILYGRWNAMLSRCFNENVKCYPRYGGRGITVCPEWKDDYSSFRDYMLSLPDCPFDENGKNLNPAMTIDRIRNNEDYKPGNMRWVSMGTQGNNKSNNMRVRVDGVLMGLKEVVRLHSKLPFDTVYQRITVLKWSIRDALKLPLYARPNS